jgi:transcriptional regulator of met regulon
LVGHGRTKLRINNLKQGGSTMKKKKFTHAITFSTTPEEYGALKKDSDEYGISTSELMRRITQDYLYGTHSYSRPLLEEREIEETSNEGAN